ncbi:MAG: hypothetical protein P4M14_12310 [Gammaproteobacteria bacterium]|nr:hypothetical protein [Gammaproteobacteria bacterium]
MIFNKISGLTLLEVLLSLALLSFALLGMDAMEVAALGQANENYYFNVAENQMQSLVERLRVLGSSAGIESIKASWNEEAERALPLGSGAISGAYPIYTLIIYWGIQHGPCIKPHLGLSGCLTENLIV